MVEMGVQGEAGVSLLRSVNEDAAGALKVHKRKLQKEYLVKEINLFFLSGKPDGSLWIDVKR